MEDRRSTSAGRAAPRRSRRPWGTERDRDRQAQTAERSGSVLMLRARFDGLGLQSRRPMPQADGRVGAVSLLSAGPARAEAVELALSQ